MKSRFEQIKQWIVEHQSDIILAIGVILISLLSFAMGYIVAKQQEKEPIKIEQIPTNYESKRITNDQFISNLVIFVIRGNS